MFEHDNLPRVFGTPLGVDFPVALLDGLKHRLTGAHPEDWARVEIFVNTRRMQRRLYQLLEAGPAMLMPRIRLITDLTSDPIASDLPETASHLRRKLELAEMVQQLLDHQPDLAPRSALFDLADSLTLLLAEMADENVSPDVLQNLNVSDSSGHWQRSQLFLGAIGRFFDPDGGDPHDSSTRLRVVTDRLIERWNAAPPTHPIIIAGSTGSRGTTSRLMQAVAALPQGAVILPGFDFDLPDQVWETLEDVLTGEDHPQFRFAKLMNSLQLSPKDVPMWSAQIQPSAPDRNRLVSLALRPAPVTNQWMAEGPDFVGVERAMSNVTLLEAPTTRIEALAISMVMRQALEQDKTVALVTPDRTLTRLVKASLDRWAIEPDVSVGDPLALSAPGRLFQHVADNIGRQLSSEALLVLLKHPLVNSGSDARGQHLLWTRELELYLRRKGVPFPDSTNLMAWAQLEPDDQARVDWVNWIESAALGLNNAVAHTVQDFVALHLRAVEDLAIGHQSGTTDELWAKQAGEEARKTLTELQLAAAFGGTLSPLEYRALFRSVVARGEMRDPVLPHPGVMIWGTLEARVQGADLVILGGLNEGVWPENPSPDPWLNRTMRKDAGLLLPERRVGLSAHDFQQAVGAGQVVLSRSLRDAEAETVPSRWVNRLTNLLEGMSPQAADALKACRAKGQVLVDLALALDAPETAIPPAERPSPSPPVSSRPDILSVTAISRLIRDPYAIYAQYTLNLKKLDPLQQRPGAALRGTVLHKVLERFVNALPDSFDHTIAKTLLQTIAHEVLSSDVPWPTARVFWQTRLDRVIDEFIAGELRRKADGDPIALEEMGKMAFADLNFTLTAKVDRIDRLHDGTLRILDYKTGTVPTAPQLRYFDKQLVLEAVMAEAGAFEKIGPSKVSQVAHIGLGAVPKFDVTTLDAEEIIKIRDEFRQLISEYQNLTTGYTSRRAVSTWRFDGDFDHLARFGEWDESDDPTLVAVGT